VEFQKFRAKLSIPKCRSFDYVGNKKRSLLRSG
jgi:hypothetical protein